jgi:hypothetical protein
MVDIPWPYTHAPGDESQEGAGKLINVFVERRGDDQAYIWRRVAGCTVFAREPSVGAANGTSLADGRSIVTDADAAAAGTSTATAASVSLQTLTGSGAATGSAAATASRSVIIAVAGAAGGSSYANADGVEIDSTAFGSAGGSSTAGAAGDTV